MRLSDDFLYNLRQSNDIVDVMSSYIDLKKSSRDYVCLCPFHSEKTPSCHVYVDTQSFYCFGCHAGGDVVTFVRMYENLDYMESVRFLAQRAGISMPEDANDDTAMQKTRLLEINREAGRFYHYQLFSPQGREGLEYLLNRGLSEHTIKTYGLGYASDNWEQLKMYMRGKGFSEDELESASLLSRNNNKTYDFFRYRVMFPFFDLRGNIIGFSGRVIGGNDPRKYLNTRGTLVYNKSMFLYSMNHAKNSKEKYLILSEGNVDVISLFQAGFTNAVATCGTAITPEHARIMRNQGFEQVIIAYDSDEAGQKATVKAINILNEVGISARILQINGAKDPDEFIKKFGAEAFKMLIEKSNSAIDFELAKLKKGIDLNTAQGKADYLKKSIKFLADINNKLDRAVYISQVAEACDVSKVNIENAVTNEYKYRRKNIDRDERQRLISGVHQRDKLNPDAEKYPIEAKAERGIIAFLFNSPDYLKKVTSKLEVEDFPTGFHRKIYELLKIKLEENMSIELAALGSEFSTDEMGRLTGIIKEGNALPYSIDRLNDYISILLKFKENKTEKSVVEMSATELLEYAERLKNNK